MARRKLTEDTPVGVHENITPITKQPVLEVHANRWHEMSVMELYDQKSILIGRTVIASQIGSHSLLEQLQMGIARLDAIIMQKSDDEDNSII